MILHALYQLYDRLEKDDAYDVAPEGYSLQKISFVIALEEDGTLTEIQDHRTGDGNQSRPQIHRVPGGAKPPGAGINPCLLWDNTGYLLGFKPDDPKPERSLKTFEASRDHHLVFEKEVDHPAYSAVCRFLESWNPERLTPVAELAGKIAARDASLAVAGSELADDAAKSEAREKAAALDLEIAKVRKACGEDESKLAAVCAITSGFGVFKLRKALNFVHELPEIDKWWQHRLAAAGNAGTSGMCLITGEREAPIADLHAPKIKGVKNAQGAGALIVSFNTNAYESFARESGHNAPVSEEAAGRYCKALNALLASDRHRLQIGDATTVFWTEKPTRTESALNAFFGSDVPDDDRPDGEASQVTTLLVSLESSLRSVRDGGKPEPEIADESKVPFYILGLTGQAGGRIGVRFWHRTDVGDLIKKLAQHHRDLAIVPQWDADSKRPDPEFPPLWMLLRQTGREPKDIPPNLSGALMRSILHGTPYPELLAASVVNRIRADREINYLRTAILKAILVRNHHIDMKEALDKTHPKPAYHLGRLFAVYETAQRHAHDWTLERTIRETMYSSASAAPLAVFGRLERLHHHHTAKKNHPPGSSESYSEIVSEIGQNFHGSPVYPASLNLQDQSLFAVGYYHQLHHFRTLSGARSKRSGATGKTNDAADDPEPAS